MNRPILNYHAVGSTSSQSFAPWAIGLAEFVEHLDLIAGLGLHGVTVADALQSPQADQVALSFDDGYEDFVTTAVPELMQRGFSATLFVATAYVGESSRWLEPHTEAARPMATWPQLRDVDAHGFEIASHSHTHPQLDLLSHADVVTEVQQSRQLLEQELGHRVAGFCYPHGFHGSKVRQAVIDAGYDYACAVKHKMSHDLDDRFALSRIVVTGDATTDALSAMLQGEHLRRGPTWAEHAMARGFREYRRLRRKLTS